MKHDDKREERKEEESKNKLDKGGNYEVGKVFFYLIFLFNSLKVLVITAVYQEPEQEVVILTCHERQWEVAVKARRINTFKLPLGGFLSLPHKARLLTGCGIKNEISLSFIM